MFKHIFPTPYVTLHICLFYTNRVDIEETVESKTPAAGVVKKKKTYDLQPFDRFWQAQKGSPFPEVAEAVQVELDSYRFEFTVIYQVNV